MVSYADLPGALVARLIGATRDEGREFYVHHRSRRHRMCRDASETTEHLVCNFDPTSTSQFVDREHSQTKLTGRNQNSEDN